MTISQKSHIFRLCLWGNNILVGAFNESVLLKSLNVNINNITHNINMLIMYQQQQQQQQQQPVLFYRKCFRFSRFMLNL